MIKLHWKHIAITLAVLPFAALIFAWIGFFNVGASSGHWKITDWFLHFAMRSAVRTYALSVEVPDKLPAEAVKPAAGHFARGCAVCHGAPGEPRSPTVMNMLPLPPDLSEVVGEWNDAELFRIVKHGVRFTGMPAWPTQDRDDEVWAMVAFLRELPGMSPQDYAQLAYGRDSAPALHAGSLDQAVAECSRCHGEDGRQGGSMTPILAGQNEPYLIESLRAYLDGRRASGIMALPVKTVDPAELVPLARHFAQLSSAPASGSEADPGLVAQGEAIATNGVPQQNVPACLSCHGAGERNPRYPSIAGQKPDYIAAQLTLFRAGQRGGTDLHGLMTNAAKGLTDADIAALAAYFSSMQLPEADSR